jgi:hypothetical protein
MVVGRVASRAASSNGAILGRRAGDGQGKARPDPLAYSAFTFASRITLPHFSDSLLM